MVNGSDNQDSVYELPRGEIAIVGMACLFPGAPDLASYWRNIVGGIDAIADVPPGRWDVDPFYDPSSDADDRVYSKRGGYLPAEIPFDPLAYGIMPRGVSGGEVDQFLVLKLVDDALRDAGYGDREIPGERTEFILGRGNYLGPGNSNLFQRSVGIEQALRILKTLHPEHTAAELEAIRRELRSSLPDFGPELGPTHIPNVVTGRAANRLDLMGRNYTVDAACASSLIALETAMDDLLSGKCDLAIAGGSHTFTCVPLLMVFSTLNALSHGSEIRPFDAGADGTLPGEGIGIVVLKRRADAERDGDRIYAVVKGVGSASDGRALSVMAPRLEGEVLALQRAYARAGIAPETVQLIEAHGTATLVGDATEAQALKAVFGARGERPHIALGTVKSMIGHAMPASGIAGIIKTALALHHKVLPPTLHCETPSPALGLDESPLYVNTEARPWIDGAGVPRRAGVNAFGFGGINAHAVLEEHRASQEEQQDLLPWESELFLVGAATREELVAEVERLEAYVAARPETVPADLAFTLAQHFQASPSRLAIIASSIDDLARKLARAHKLLARPDCAQIKDPRGIYYVAQPLAGSGGKIAYLFPGEGSQKLNMLADLCLHFPPVRAAFDTADRAILSQGRSDPISADIFPPPFHSEDERRAAERRLWRIDRQCEAIMAANRAMLALLDMLGVRPDMMAGHSIGEWSSLTASGIAEPDPPVEALQSLDAMVKAIDRDPTIPEATLLAVATDRASANALIDGIENAYVALDNCPHQVVLAIGGDAAKDAVLARLRERGIAAEESRFNRGSHTPLFSGFCTLVRHHFETVTLSVPRVDVYSGLTAAPLPHDPAAIRELLVQSWEQPVEFRRTVEAMYEAGARVFIEVGPGGVLSAFTDDILRKKNPVVLAVDLPKWPAITGVNHLVGMLTAHGYDLNVAALFARRPLRELTLDPAHDASPAQAMPPVILRLGIPMMSLSATAAPTQAREQQEGSAAAAPASEQVAALERAGSTPEAAPTLVPAGVDSNRVGTSIPAAETLSDAQGPAAMGSSSRAPLHETASTPLLADSTLVGSAGPHAAPATAAPVDEGAAGPHAAETLPAALPPQSGGWPDTAGTGPGVMDHYLTTMRRFLQAEQRVMQSVLSTAPRHARMPAHASFLRAAPAVGPDNTVGALPLLGEILSFVPGQSLVARRRFDPDEDLYLHHHTFGGQMSLTDPMLEPLMVAPLTISLELMAEAAAQLAPGLVLASLLDIRAHRWLQVDDDAPTILEITAQRLPGDETRVRVEVREGTTESSEGAMVIEGTMVFAAGYASPQLQPPPPLTAPRTPARTARQMYDEKWMFHGPSFQGVASLDASGDDGIVGRLEVLPTGNLFRSVNRPVLLTDVALLDAAGQLLGYWAKERLASSFVVFPIRVAAIHMYRPNLPVGTQVQCYVHVTEIVPQMIKVDMRVDDPWGQPWIEILGWQDWRFHIVGPVYDFWRFPASTVMSAPYAPPLPAPYPYAVTCYRMDTLQHLGQTMVTKSLAYMALNHAERRTYHRLNRLTTRQIEWLAGRIAAKDAVRMYLLQHYNLHVGPGDIEIIADEHGQPWARGAWEQQAPAPLISLTHADGSAVAIAVSRSYASGVGIDLQRIAPRDPDFDAIAFSPDERALLDGADGVVRDERRTRLWCAKEAAAKALGIGLVDGPHSVVVVEWNEETGVAGLTLGATPLERFPHLAGRRLTAYTRRDGAYIVATALDEGAWTHRT